MLARRFRCCAWLVLGLILGPGALAAAKERPPQPPVIPPETPVADVVLAAADQGALTHTPAALWPLKPGQPLRLVYPLEQPATEIDPYGWRYSDARQAWRMHAGQDLLAPEGTAVLAMLPGRVLLVEELDGYGLTVVLDHGHGWQSLYAHLLDAAVQVGDVLPAASLLGRVGQSGRATAPHLHVELRRRSGDRVLAVDPTPWLLQAPPPLQQAQGGHSHTP